MKTKRLSGAFFTILFMAAVLVRPWLRKTQVDRTKLAMSCL